MGVKILPEKEGIVHVVIPTEAFGDNKGTAVWMGDGLHIIVKNEVADDLEATLRYRK